jgi:hypothetical protein
MLSQFQNTVVHSKGYVRGAGGHTHLYVGYLYAVGSDTCLERDELKCNESLPSQACSSLNEDTIAARGQLSSDKLLHDCHWAARCSQSYEAFIVILPSKCFSVDVTAIL